MCSRRFLVRISHNLFVENRGAIRAHLATQKFEERLPSPAMRRLPVFPGFLGRTARRRIARLFILLNADDRRNISVCYLAQIFNAGSLIGLAHKTRPFMVLRSNFGRRTVSDDVALANPHTTLAVLFNLGD